MLLLLLPKSRFINFQLVLLILQLISECLATHDFHLHEESDPNKYCSEEMGLDNSYHRDGMDKCCKNKFLGYGDEGLILIQDLKGECRHKSVKDYPDDDLATFMWRVEACHFKGFMGVKEEEISYKSLVEFLTRNYTTEEDVQKLIRDANTECPDGDGETEFYKKLQAYLTCYYTNEEKVCKAPGVNGTSTSNRKSKCKRVPGVMHQNRYCCNGKPTPESYHKMMLVSGPVDNLMKNMSELKKVDECELTLHNLTDQLSKKEIDSALSKNMNQEEIHRIEDLHHLQFNCLQACIANPVVFSDETGVEPVITNWNLDSTINSFIPEVLPEKVKKDLKDFHTKRRELKVRVPIEESNNGTEVFLTFKEIEDKYAATKSKKEKIIYYCAYYREIEHNAAEAFDNHCE